MDMKNSWIGFSGIRVIDATPPIGRSVISRTVTPKYFATSEWQSSCSVTKKNIPKTMKTEYDADLCIGCGLCVSTCSEVYKMEDDKAVVITAVVPKDAEENCQKACDECPVTAIVVTK